MIKFIYLFVHSYNNISVYNNSSILYDYVKTYNLINMETGSEYIVKYSKISKLRICVIILMIYVISAAEMKCIIADPDNIKKNSYLNNLMAFFTRKPNLLEDVLCNNILNCQLFILNWCTW